uniref:Uncharacterized protein n=1 Tax=Quercus lobata TaxID=97700 RepID=A0A7N2MLM4_QUELO
MSSYFLLLVCFDCANFHFDLRQIVIQTVWKVGKDGVEAGTNLVPDSVPRPIARISVTVVALTVSLFVLKSFLSTAFFALDNIVGEEGTTVYTTVAVLFAVPYWPSISNAN